MISLAVSSLFINHKHYINLLNFNRAANRYFSYLMLKQRSQKIAEKRKNNDLLLFLFRKELSDFFINY